MSEKRESISPERIKEIAVDLANGDEGCNLADLSHEDRAAVLRAFYGLLLQRWRRWKQRQEAMNLSAPPAAWRKGMRDWPKLSADLALRRLGMDPSRIVQEIMAEPLFLAVLWAMATLPISPPPAPSAIPVPWRKGP